MDCQRDWEEVFATLEQDLVSQIRVSGGECELSEDMKEVFVTLEQDLVA